MQKTMRTVNGLLWAAIVSVSLFGCGDKGSAGDAPSSSASPSASGAKGGDAKTDSGGKKDKVLADKEYVTCHFTKAYAKDDFQEEKPQFECKNATDKDFNQLQFKVFYYDKDKKQVDAFLSAQNGQPTMKAGETKKFLLGKKKEDMKPDTTPQVAVLSGVFADGEPWEYPPAMKFYGSDRPMTDD